MSIETNLKRLGLVLPPAPSAIAAYLPVKKLGNMIFTSGQIPLKEGKVVNQGKVGKELSIEKAGEALEICCLNALSAIQTLIELTEIKNISKISVFVASDAEFYEQHLVANYASNLLIGIFDEKGKHTRSALGVSSLPLNACVELELIVEI
jgi:enamine deaminase RidA (YjgF/YER057c/UK114 family)